MPVYQQTKSGSEDMSYSMDLYISGCEYFGMFVPLSQQNFVNMTPYVGLSCYFALDKL